MGFHSGSITLDGTIQNLETALGTTRARATQVKFYNIPGNDPVNVGGPEHETTLSATVHGFQVNPAVLAGGQDGTEDIGPFSSTGAVIGLADVYVLGTNNEILGVSWVTP